MQATVDAALEALADRLAIATGAAEPHPGRRLELGPLRDFVAVQVAEAEGFAVLRDREERERIERRLGELQARREVEAALGDVHEHLAVLAEIGRWEEDRAQLSTRKISQRIGELSRLAITGRLKDGLSMVYSFFHSGEDGRSLGSYMILDHVRAARELKLPYVYLGYWVRGSEKMDYKTRFQPLEALTQNGWEALEV